MAAFICTEIEEKYDCIYCCTAALILYRNRGGFDLHLIAVQSCTENEVYGCIYLQYGQAQNSRCTTALKAVQSAFIWHRNRGCTTAVFAGHEFPDFEIKSVVKISCIFTVFLS